MPLRLSIPSGSRFGRLTIVKEVNPVPRTSPRGTWRRFLVRCDCGSEFVTRLAELRCGKTVSCGCARVERAVQMGLAKATHGETRGGKSSVEHRVWSRMIERCERPASDSYPRYGGRGIRVCERWRQSFESFLKDMGRRPSPDHSIDRIDNDGNYEPGNCRWATRSEQAKNRSRHGFDQYNEKRKRA